MSIEIHDIPHVSCVFSTSHV